MKTRGERLKARRLEMKLTLREVAEAVDISIAGVQNLERGDVMPSLEIGIALAKCLRKPVHWVLYGTEYDPDRIPVIGTTESGPDEEWKPGQVPNTERFLPFISQRNTVYALTISNLTQETISQAIFSWSILRWNWSPARMFWFVILQEISLSSAWPVLMMKITIWMEQTHNAPSSGKAILNLFTK